MKFTFKQFQEKYPNDDVCLDKIFQTRYSNMKFCPECAAETAFYRVKRRKCYECKHCGYQVFPMAGTIFENTKTPLTKWFHAMYLMTATRNGVSGKEIERHLGVTYKCAWRMGHQLRKLMAQTDSPMLFGEVQIDEAYLGGYRRGKSGRGAKNKTVVIGMVQKNGNVVAHSIPDMNKGTMLKAITDKVAKGTVITTDELMTYKTLPKLGYTHFTVQHRLAEFVSKIGKHTNTIEGFWSILKRSISGTHVWVSPKYLNQYIDEFEFRYNNRHSIVPMFETAFEALRPSLIEPQSLPDDSGLAGELPF